MNKLERVINFAYDKGFINLKEKQEIECSQNILYDNLEKLKDRKFENNESYVIHYGREDIYCECMMCKKKSHKFYEIYDSPVYLVTDERRYSLLEKYRNKYYICENCMNNNKELQYRFL